MQIDFDRFAAPLISALFRGSLPDWQAAPMRRIIEGGLARDRSIPEMAYALATGYHETMRFLRMHEIGRGSAHLYGQPVATWRNQTRAYYGRGLPHLTWLGNYGDQTARLSARLGRPIDLINNPDLAADPEISAEILWEGMIHGSFTGRKLSDYFSTGRRDYDGAREIINGSDRAGLIAAYARQFEAALAGAEIKAAG